jgi:hypothetical protein
MRWRTAGGSSWYQFPPSWTLALTSWREGGAETGSAKAEVMLACDFDIVSIGVSWREEIRGNLDEKGWVLVSSGSF